MDEGTLLRRIEIRYGRVARLLARMTKMKRPQNSEYFKSEVNGWTLGAFIITMTVLGIRKATTGQVCARYYESVMRTANDYQRMASAPSSSNANGLTFITATGLEAQKE
jgi:hypothetical protein